MSTVAAKGARPSISSDGSERRGCFDLRFARCESCCVGELVFFELANHEAARDRPLHKRIDEMRMRNYSAHHPRRLSARCIDRRYSTRTDPHIDGATLFTRSSPVGPISKCWPLATIENIGRPSAFIKPICLLTRLCNDNRSPRPPLTTT